MGACNGRLYCTRSVIMLLTAENRILRQDQDPRLKIPQSQRIMKIPHDENPALRQHHDGTNDASS